jgi:signal transduction histidine kinase
MSAFFKAFLHKDGLTLSQNNIYRNFNILLAVALLDIAIIMFWLKDLDQRWPIQICITESVLLIVLMYLHMRGHLMFARYSTFLLVLIVQSTACILHGKDDGFDYIFYALAVLPTLFFTKPVYYISLFTISIAAMLTIQYTYSFYEPLVIIPGDFIFYWNIFSTGALILLVMYIFKSGYERTQKKLLEQHNVMAHQKEEIEVINNNLEQLIVDRTEKLKDQETRITKFAFINAHKVRSPLARIMGLLNLISLEKDKTSAVEQYLPKLQSNAEELNEMLREVSVTLHEIKIENGKKE